MKRFTTILLTFVMMAVMVSPEISLARSGKGIAKLNSKKVTMTVGQSKKLKVIKSKKYQIKRVKWKSSKPKVAKISKKGRIRALTAGTAKVKATFRARKRTGKNAKFKKYTLRCTVKVKAKAKKTQNKTIDDPRTPTDSNPDSNNNSNDTTQNNDQTRSNPSSNVVPNPNPDPSPNVVPNPNPNPSPNVVPNPNPNPSPNIVPNPNPNPSPNPDPNPNPSGSKTLVVYFSRAGHNYVSANNYPYISVGNTEVVAKKIIAKTGADEFKLVPQVPYPDDYSETLTIAQNEKNNNSRPEYQGSISSEEWAKYENVFIGFPIWHGDMPMIVYTFLEAYDWTGKTIIPFNTHAGSGQAGTQSTIRSKCVGANVKSGFSIPGTTAQNSKDSEISSLNEWLNGLGIDFSASSKVGVFDLNKRAVLLNSGHEMPVLGIGTYRLSDSQAENSVYWALKDGYRLIDTARIYGNEAGVGRGIKKAVNEGICKREDIFVTTKMWTSDFDNGDQAVQNSLDRLDLDYIDLMILHHSQPSNDVAAYKAMERAVAADKLKSIGLSNYYTAEDFDRLVNATTITPALLQNETHPYHQSTAMKKHLAKYGTVMESWFPLGGRGNTQTLFNDETISSIAKKHGKTSAQVILRWHLQAGNIAIPGSSNADHILENISIFDFALTDSEMKQLTNIDKNRRFASF